MLDSEEKQSLTILVNTRYARITIHKSTLKALKELHLYNWVQRHKRQAYAAWS